jgi:2-polyprenyl-3-methyl-5-hydroxy-6-metoxy-1,4-benzoquinol methylase
MERGVYQKFYEVDKNHFWKISRRRLILEWLQRYAQDKRGLKILDIGGACSILSSDMRKLGQVTVIEPDSETVKIAKELFAIDIRYGKLPNDIPVEGLYDVVTLLDVLEHIDDDKEAIKSVWKLLRPGGLFLCTVPAFQWLWSSHDVALHHKRRYHCKGLFNLLQAAGFEIKRFSYYTSLFFPITVLHRLARKVIPPEKPGTYSAPIQSVFINSLLCAIMSIERFALRYVDLPFGSSLIAVCFKPMTYEYGQKPIER